MKFVVSGLGSGSIAGRIVGSIAGMALWVSLVSGFPVIAAENENDPVFFIKTPEKTFQFQRSELLNRKDQVSITVTEDPTYPGSARTYTAVPLVGLFIPFKLLTSGDAGQEISLFFHCLDGFSAPIPIEKVLDTDRNHANAFLAIEEPGRKWPAVRSQEGPATAGPFYLIWKNPEASKIGAEEWPYQLSGFEVKKSLRALYPALFPDSSLPKEHPARQGFEVFLKNCFACHTLNHQGESKLGPDLNLPMNPTEYFTEKVLLQFIRNPESVRSWSGSKMKPVSKEAISDAELGALVEYLKHMRHRS